jgi:hypothetical protein
MLYTMAFLDAYFPYTYNHLNEMHFLCVMYCHIVCGQIPGVFVTLVVEVPPTDIHEVIIFYARRSSSKSQSLSDSADFSELSSSGYAS